MRKMFQILELWRWVALGLWGSMKRLSINKPLMSYLKYIFVQQPRPKHSDTVCADYCVVPSQQIQGLYLLTVQVEGHRLVLHTVGYPVPSERTKREWELTDKLSLGGKYWKYFVFEDKSVAPQNQQCNELFHTPFKSSKTEVALSLRLWRFWFP